MKLELPAASKSKRASNVTLPCTETAQRKKRHETTVCALAYVVDRGHVQYAGRLSLAEQLRHVQQGHGQSGVNRDYVPATVKAIEAAGFRDTPLRQLAMMLHDAHPLHPPRPGERETS